MTTSDTTATPASDKRPITAIIAGAGHRSLRYASYAQLHPDQLIIAGVAEPDPVRRALTAERFGLDADRAFASVEELAAAPRFADAAINGTVDHLHVPTTICLLEAGYDVLLEKPIATSSAELERLYEAERRTNRRVLVCHVLRYAPFYRQIKEIVLSGALGELVNIQTNEHVSYHHMAVSYVRGKWSSLAECRSPMLMSKCCHDLDIVAWLAASAPARVSSFGSRSYFRPENAPPGSGTRCLADCAIEADCPYSARKHYVEQGRWGFYVWDNSYLGDSPPTERKLESLRTDNRYGRCVWRCDNDVVDRQSVMIEFANGCTATHNMVGGTSRPCRTIHLLGTKGEISGTLEEGRFALRFPDPRKDGEYTEEFVSVAARNDSHGGGDLRLVADFVRLLQGEPPSVSCTSLRTSLHGHRIGFLAEQSRLESRTMTWDAPEDEEPTHAYIPIKG